jgi:hypothetical protein
MMSQRADGKQVQSAQATQQADATKATTQTQAAQQAQKAESVQQSEKKDKVFFHKSGTGRGSFQGVTRGGETSRTQTMITKLVEDMENGQKVMDRLIKAGMSGKDFSSSELISLQAGMYKYTQELELTGKVVEKATSGLKDTLRTQV